MNISEFSEMNILKVNTQKFLHSLSSETRQGILMFLGEHGESNVGHISEKLCLGISTVSEHLKQLHDAQLVLRVRKGKEVYYKINTDGIIKQLDTLSNWLKSCC